MNHVTRMLYLKRNVNKLHVLANVIRLVLSGTIEYSCIILAEEIMH